MLRQVGDVRYVTPTRREAMEAKREPDRSIVGLVQELQRQRGLLIDLQESELPKAKIRSQYLAIFLIYK